jgi:hypothetical protein
MNTRPLEPREAAGLAALNELRVPSALVFVTATGLRKSILDATDPVRRLLLDQGIHDYGQQGQGPENKRVLPAVLVDNAGLHDLEISIYRPVTKQGDPRFWPALFSRHAAPGDVVAMGVLQGRIHLFNLTRVDLRSALEEGTSLHEYVSGSTAPAITPHRELLSRLRQLALAGPLKSVGHGDTAVGMTVEHALGISPNSSTAPDFLGKIELKSGRVQKAPTRATLFACVPDWKLSALKSSGEILERFGYDRNGALKLYCTVSARRPNSQGLILQVDSHRSLLKELHRLQDHNSDVAVWRMERLEGSLMQKHRETFWIKARAEKRADGEYFHLRSVVHTSQPNLPQFQRLLGDGGITLDHLIKRKPTGGAAEKGPFFKITRERIPELFFGAPREYAL